MAEGICKPHYSNQDSSPLDNAVYITVIKQNPLHNGNIPITDSITDPITKMGVAHTVGQYPARF